MSLSSSPSPSPSPSPPPPPFTIKTVKVTNVSLSATPHDMQEFFSFSGLIEYIEMKSVNERSQTAFVTFMDPKGADTAVLLSGATIVDQPVEIAPEPDYELPSVAFASKAAAGSSENKDAAETEVGSGAYAVQKAEDVVTTMLAKGYILGQDAVNKAKDFDQRHQVLSTATAKVVELDNKIGLSEKVSIGATIVNDKMKDMDHKYQVSEKTKSALAVAEEKVSRAMKNRYILTGATWVTGAFSRVTQAAEGVGQKTMEKVSEEQQQREATITTDNYNELPQEAPTDNNTEPTKEAPTDPPKEAPTADDDKHQQQQQPPASPKGGLVL